MEELVEPEGSDRKALFILLLAVFIDLLGFGIIIPILPFFTTDYLGGTELILAWLLAIYSLTQFIFAPLWGKLSDNVGRRPIILIGLFGSSISFLVFGLSTNLEMLFISRAMAGFFTGASLPTARAYIADTTPPEERAAGFGLIGAAFGLGFTLGPVIGSILANFSFWGISSIVLPSFAAAVLTLFNFIGAVFWLPESRSKVSFTETSPQSSLFNISEIRSLLNINKVGLLIITFASLNLVFSGFESMFPLYAESVDPNVDEKTIGYVFGVIGVVIVIVQGGLIRPIVAKYGEINTIRIGLLFVAVGFALYPLTNTYWHLIIGAIPLAIGVGISNPSLNSELSNRVPDDKQGTIMGLNSGLSSLMRVIGTLIAGLFYTWNYTSHFIFGAIVLIIIFILNLSEYEQPAYQQVDRSVQT